MPLTTDSTKDPKKIKHINDRIIDRALVLSGLRRNIFYIAPKALYFAYLDEANLSLLSDFETQKKPVLEMPVQNVFNYWKEQWLSKVLKKKRNTENFQRFKREEIFLSRKIIEFEEQIT